MWSGSSTSFRNRLTEGHVEISKPFRWGEFAHFFSPRSDAPVVVCGHDYDVVDANVVEKAVGGERLVESRRDDLFSSGSFSPLQSSFDPS